MWLTEKDIAKVLENTITIDENKRRDAIINYIDSHQGCTAEDIVKENKQSGRVKTFRILKDLKKGDVIREEKSDTNKRDKKLFLNETNPLVSFPKEVKEFKEHLYRLFREAKDYRWWDYEDEVYCPSGMLLRDCFSLFFEYLNINNYRAFVIWPNTIKDKDTLSKLYMLFYNEMTELNLRLREKYLPLEYEVSVKDKKRLAKGMDKEEYLTIAKNAALDAMDVIPDDLHFEEIQRTFYECKLDNMSRPIVQCLKDLRENIYYTQASQLERNSLREFREERGETEMTKLKRQKELEKLAKKLKVIDSERKKNRDIPYPHCNYDYGSVTKWYDPTTGKSVLSYTRKLDLAHPFKPKR
jgi:hypothetical protein